MKHRPTSVHTPAHRRPAHRRALRSVLWGAVFLVLLGLGGLAGMLALTGRTLPLPQMAVVWVESQVNARLAGGGTVALGAVDLVVDADLAPRLSLRDLRLMDAKGAPLLNLPDVRVFLSPALITERRLALTELRVFGAELTLLRDATGVIRVDMGANLGTDAGQSAPWDLAGAQEALRRALTHPLLADVTRIEGAELTVVLRDAQKDREWQFDAGRILITQNTAQVQMALALNVPMGAVMGPNVGQDATVSVALDIAKSDGQAQLSADLRGLAPAWVAAQTPGLAGLAQLRAPLSLRLAAQLDPAGVMGPVTGVAQLGAGRIDLTSARVAAGDAPQSQRALGPILSPVLAPKGQIVLEGLRFGFSYDPVQRRIGLDGVQLQTPLLQFAGAGHLDLPADGFDPARPMVAQLRLADLRFTPGDLFPDPVVFDQAAVDLRLQLSPFRLDLGQVLLSRVAGGAPGQDALQFELNGQILASADGLIGRLDGVSPQLSNDQIMALWPEQVIPMTRAWLAKNWQSGQVRDARLSLRVRPGDRPVVAVGFDFADVALRVVPTLPSITGAGGHVIIENDSLNVVVDAGGLAAPTGGWVDLAGSVFHVPDTRQKAALAHVDLHSQSTVTAALSVLDLPPFGYLSKAGLPVDLAQGRATLAVGLDFPLAKQLGPGDLQLQGGGVLRDVLSTQLVAKRRLRADEITVALNDAGVELAGAGWFDDLPLQAKWNLGFGAAAGGKSRLEGRVDLSPLALRTLGIELPNGALLGAAPGKLVLDFAPKMPPRFTFSSPLTGTALALPMVGWQKTAETAGRLELEGRLALGSAPAEVERFLLDTPGLGAEGAILLNNTGALTQIRLSRVEIGGWLRAEGALINQGVGQPLAIQIDGGSFDLRQANFVKAPASEAGPMDLTLDKLILSDGMMITAFKASIPPGKGLSGPFQGLVNGAAAIRGNIIPSKEGSSFQVWADDAGAVFRAAGIFSRGQGGTFEMTLRPEPAAGSFVGRIKVANTRVKDAPVLASLLGAVSVVGLIEQLNGAGITFNEVDADFRLTPQGVEISRSSAVGASLGVTMAGTYQPKTEEMNFTGLISPLYLVNGLGSILTRRGEGLVGFDYSLTGPADQVKVAVNPLSILTPGMFREFFRKPPPTLKNGSGG